MICDLGMKSISFLYFSNQIICVIMKMPKINEFIGRLVVKLFKSSIECGICNLFIYCIAGILLIVLALNEFPICWRQCADSGPAMRYINK